MTHDFNKHRPASSSQAGEDGAASLGRPRPPEERLLHKMNSWFAVEQGEGVRNLLTGRFMRFRQFAYLLRGLPGPDGRGRLARWWLSQPGRHDSDGWIEL